ncbi:MAG: hypothetical protein K2M67_07940, partial [Muribaculaceae bacterium]|nr:hypothetical protein [Muribaculaceae bacterium]
PQTIITYVGQVTYRELLIIYQQSATFQLAYLLRQTKWAFSVVHIKLEDLPGCAGQWEAWEVILIAKLALYFEITMLSLIKSLFID